MDGYLPSFIQYMTTCSNILMDSSKTNNSSSLAGGENKSLFSDHGAINIPLEATSQPHSAGKTSKIKEQAYSSVPSDSLLQKKKTVPSLFQRTLLALIDEDEIQTSLEQEGIQSAEVDGQMSATIPTSFHELPHSDVARLIRESRNCKEGVRDTIMPSTSSHDRDYNRLSFDDRILLELQSIGLCPDS